MAFTLTSCDKTNDVENSLEPDVVRFGGLKVNLPSNYDESVLSLSLSDLQDQFFSKHNGNLMKSKSSSEVTLSLEQLILIIDKISTKYPDTDSITSEVVEKIQDNFVGIDEKTIIENINVIDSFYTTLIRYELVLALSKETTSPSKVNRITSNNYFGHEMNSSEFWFFVWHPSLAKPIQNATNKAMELTTAKFTSTDKHFQTQADAFRHGIWNALIAKYVGEDKSDINDCIDRAKSFTDKHESGAEKPAEWTDANWEFDGAMDLQNNKIGRDYFKSVAWTEKKKGWFQPTRVKAPSEDDMANAIFEKTKVAKLVSSKSQISYYPNNLVYIVDYYAEK